MVELKTPAAVDEVLFKLDLTDQYTVQSYIEALQAEIKKLKGIEEDDDDDDDMAEAEPAAEKEAPPTAADDAADFPPDYQSGDDYEKAAEAKQAANDLKDSGDWEGALAKYTEAVLAAEPSALLYANRATALLHLGRAAAAERDCELALEMNPDSAKALRVRGKARKDLGKYEEALKDLSASQQIDFDEGTVEDLKFLTEKRIEKEKAEADERNKEEEKLRKRAEEIKKAQEEARREAREAAGGSSGGGGMGGMPGGMGGMPGGMGGMADIMNDPELVAALQNPKVQAAFQELMSGPGGPAGLMSDPSKLARLLSDPEVGPVMQKLMAKMTGGAGGMPGGMPFGAGGGGAAHGDDDDDDDMPDLDDIPDLEPVS